MMRVAFVHAGGRHLRGTDGPSDFFYGARELAARPGWEVDCLEVDAEPADPMTGLIAGRLFGRFVPPRTSPDWIARTRRILPKLEGYDVVVATATEISFGLAIWKSLGLLRKPLIGIFLGAVSFPIGSELRRYLASSLFNRLNGILFADAEKAEIQNRFGIPDEQLTVCWFGADEKFWVPPREGKNRSGILSVGNDGRRDYETLIKASRLMTEHEFTILTRFNPPGDLPDNVRWRCMSGPERYVPLGELLPFYQSCQCLVVPLKESLQPSGQSVAFQAMMCGAPVVITKTQGWWGSDVIRDGRQVTLVRSEDPGTLADAIRRSISHESDLSARNALLAAKWTASGFAERLGAVIEKAHQAE
jgi:glycosyltransferase involved in cell wall biosynthesis